MASFQDYMECPVCKFPQAHREVTTNGEVWIFCNRCGYNHRHDIKYNDEGKPLYKCDNCQAEKTVDKNWICPKCDARIEPRDLIFGDTESKGRGIATIQEKGKTGHAVCQIPEDKEKRKEFREWLKEVGKEEDCKIIYKQWDGTEWEPWTKHMSLEEFKAFLRTVDEDITEVKQEDDCPYIIKVNKPGFDEHSLFLVFATNEIDKMKKDAKRQLEYWKPKEE